MAEDAGVSVETVRDWCRESGISTIHRGGDPEIEIVASSPNLLDPLAEVMEIGDDAPDEHTWREDADNESEKVISHYHYNLTTPLGKSLQLWGWFCVCGEEGQGHFTEEQALRHQQVHQDACSAA